MSIDYTTINKGGISLSTNFELLSDKPLDSRLVVPSLEGLENYINNKAAYEGMIVFDKDTKKNYQVINYGDTLIYEELKSSDKCDSYDIIITDENTFARDCLYPLHRTRSIENDIVKFGEFNPSFKQDEPDDGFYAKRILVRDVTFTETLGTGDIDLFIFRSCIDYVRFENCKWKCKWRISGARPEFLKSSDEYMRAPGKLKLTIDGIQISEEDVLEAKDKADLDHETRYYIGLRNFGRIQNCWINYPKNYELSNYNPDPGSAPNYKESFKMNLQYFENAQDCKLTAFWSGENLSDCRVSEQIKYCKNICNIVCEPMYKESLPIPVEINTCSNIANIYGDHVKYISCEGIASTEADLKKNELRIKDYVDTKNSELEVNYKDYLIDNSEFDLIVTSKTDFLNIQTLDDPKIKSILVTNFIVGSGNGFFSDQNYVDSFRIPECVKYIKFAKSFQVTAQNAAIQGHPGCVIDGFPAANPNYQYRQCSALLDFKEVINSKSSNYFANTDEMESGISNRLVVGGKDLLSDTGSLYNFTGTKFMNCSISYIDGADNITNCELTATKSGNVFIANAKNINNLLVKRNVSIDSCSNLSNISIKDENIKIIYKNCKNIDFDTCVNADINQSIFVLKEENKSLSTNDLTNELKNEYDNAYEHSISMHAPVNSQENIIEAIEVNGQDQIPSNKKISITIPTGSLASLDVVQIDNLSDELRKEIDSKVTSIPNKGLSSNDLTDDLVIKIDNSITESDAIRLIANANHLKAEVVLSISDITKTGILYLIKDTNVTGIDQYKEYLLMDVGGDMVPVCIGDTSMDLSEYVTFDSISALKSEGKNSIATKEAANLAIGNYSSAFGSMNTVGAKAWYIAAIVYFSDDFQTTHKSRIYLRSEEYADGYYPEFILNPSDDELDRLDTTYYADIDLGYSEVLGYDIAIKNYAYYAFFGAKILSITGYKVEFEGSLGFTEINTSVTTQNYSFWLPKHPESNGPLILGSASFSSGSSNSVTHSYAHAEGYGNIISGKYGHAEGNSNKAGGSAHAEGQSTSALGENSHSEGYGTTASSDASHAEGRASIASNKQAHAEGYDTKASGESAHAEGNSTNASNKAAHSEGSGSIASGPASHAEGYGTQAVGARAHAEGNSSIAEGQDSHAEGYRSKSSGICSHAEGSFFNNVSTTASGEGSHAEGGGTLASGKYAHSEGRGTVSSGIASHSEGVNTQALAAGAHAEGYGTIAKAAYQHVQGKYNKINDPEVDRVQYVSIIGWGSSDAEDQRKNIHTLDTEGNSWYKGDLYVRGNDKDSAAKVATENWTNLTLNGYAKSSDIPTDYLKAGDLKGYATENYVDRSIPKNISAFNNDNGYTTAKDITGSIFNILVVDEMPENPDPAIIYIVKDIK